MNTDLKLIIPKTVIYEADDESDKIKKSVKVKRIRKKSELVKLFEIEEKTREISKEKFFVTHVDKEYDYCKFDDLCEEDKHDFERIAISQGDIRKSFESQHLKIETENLSYNIIQPRLLSLELLSLYYFSKYGVVIFFDRSDVPKKIRQKDKIYEFAKQHLIDFYGTIGYRGDGKERVHSLVVNTKKKEMINTDPLFNKVAIRVPRECFTHTDAIITLKNLLLNFREKPDYTFEPSTPPHTLFYWSPLYPKQFEDEYVVRDLYSKNIEKRKKPKTISEFRKKYTEKVKIQKSFMTLTMRKSWDEPDNEMKNFCIEEIIEKTQFVYLSKKTDDLFTKILRVESGLSEEEMDKISDNYNQFLMDLIVKKNQKKQ